jgi:hypothetical protein
MVSFLKKSSSTPPPEAESAALLAPPHRRSLFGRKAVLMKRSDEGPSQRRARSPFKRRKADPATPPVTPDKEDHDPHHNNNNNNNGLQVKVVTVKVAAPGASAFPSKERTTTDDETDAVDASDDTVVSDLTDNRTCKRMADYQQAVTAHDAEQLDRAHAAAADLPVVAEHKRGTVKTRLDKVQAAAAQQEGGSVLLDLESLQTDEPSQQAAAQVPRAACRGEEGDMNPVAYLLSYMDHACKADDAPKVEKSYSFVPEWGMAPSKDEREDKAAAARVTTTGKSSPGRQAHAGMPQEIHENFEMVLEDLQSTEDRLLQKRQQRNWMGAMSIRKPADAVVETAAFDPPPPPERRVEESPTEVPAAIKKDGPPRQSLSPLTVEEEKKDEEEEGTDAAPSGGVRNKMVKKFKSLRRRMKPSSNLPQISEDEELEAMNGANNLQVKVPQKESTLSEKDLIGDQVVQDIYRDLEESLQSTATRSPETVQTSDSTTVKEGRGGEDSAYNEDESTAFDKEDDSNMDGSNMITSIMTLLSGAPEKKELSAEVRDIPDYTKIPQSKSWVDQFRLTMSEDSMSTDGSWSKQQAFARTWAPNRRKKKGAWKEAKDEKTGRSYYYHRTTRETTWKKPQEMTDFEEQQGGHELVSVLSDGDLAAAADRQEPASGGRKKNARDFDPQVWAIKEKIVKLLETLEPPDGSSVDQILKQYEGKEELLLHQLREMKEARPFDEPMATDSVTTDGGAPVKSKAAVKPTVKPVVKEARTTKSKTEPQNAVSKKTSSTEAKKSKPKKTVLADAKKTETKAVELEKTESLQRETKKADAKPTGSLPKKAAELRKRLKLPRSRSATRGAQALAQVENQAAKALEPVKANRPTAKPFDPEPESSRNIHSPAAFSGRVRTYGSGITKHSEITEQIKNTARKPNALNTVGELRSVPSDATSLSSVGLEPRITVNMGASPGPIPGKISAPRSRELMVEEYSTTDRSYRAETFDKKRNVRAGRFGTTGTRRRPFTTPYTNEEDDGSKTEDDGSKTNDSISALSMDDSKPYQAASLGFLSGVFGGEKKEPVDAPRRRALDDAIAREDWDLAAALSDAMRSLKARPNVQTPPTEWRQSELDRFISQNDWDAVANYIAHVRTKSKEEEEPPALTRAVKAPVREPVIAVQEPAKAPQSAKSQRVPRRRPPPPSTGYNIEEDELENPKKRFGARSQLQHSEIHSESSWDSEESSYDSEYSSASSYSEPSRGKNRNRYRYASKHSLPVKNNRGRPKEFAC